MATVLRQVEASSFIRAPRELAYALLSSYDGYRDWCSGVTDSRVFAREGEVSIVELSCPDLGKGKLIFEYVASPDEWLLFHQVDRLREDGLSGRWDLRATEDGSGVTVTGTLACKEGLLRIGTRRRLRRVLDMTLASLAEYAALLAAVGGTVTERRLLLDVRRSSGTLQLTFDGETRLVSLPGGGVAE